MVNILIKLLIYSVFVHVLPQYFTGTTELILKSIGLIALCDLFYYDVFYKITEYFETKVNTYFINISIFVFAIFIAAISCIILDLHGIESKVISITILSLTAVVYTIESYCDLKSKINNIKKAFYKYGKKDN